MSQLSPQWNFVGVALYLLRHFLLGQIATAEPQTLSFADFINYIRLLRTWFLLAKIFPSFGEFSLLKAVLKGACEEGWLVFSSWCNVVFTESDPVCGSAGGPQSPSQLDSRTYAQSRTCVLCRQHRDSPPLWDDPFGKKVNAFQNYAKRINLRRAMC